MSMPLTKEQAIQVGELYAQLQRAEQRIIDFIGARSMPAGAGFDDQDGLSVLAEVYNKITFVKRELVVALQESQDAQDMARLSHLTQDAVQVTGAVLGELIR